MPKHDDVKGTYTDVTENITSKASIIVDHTTVVQKDLKHRIYQKMKRKRKKEHFGRASNNCSTTSGDIDIHYPGTLVAC